MKKSIAFSTLCLSFATALLPALAQGSEIIADNTADNIGATADTNTARTCGKGKGGHLQALNLTEQQKTTMDSLKTKFKATIGPKKEELMAHRKALKELLSSEKIDRNAVQLEQDKINALSADLSNSMLAFRLDMSENLTPEQRKQKQDMHSSWKNKHGGENQRS